MNRTRPSDFNEPYIYDQQFFFGRTFVCCAWSALLPMKWEFERVEWPSGPHDLQYL